MLIFEPVSHTYTWMGFPIPSLSQVLQEGGCGTDYSQIPEAVLQFARERGQAVHRAIEAKLKGEELEFTSEEAETEFQEVCAGYLVAFEVALPLLPDLTSADVEVSAGGWCGFGTTPDCVTEEAIIEWKTTSRIYPTHWVQLAGQAHALEDAGRQRIIVQLKANGRPTIKVDENTELHDDVFKAAHLISRWKGKRL